MKQILDLVQESPPAPVLQFILHWKSRKYANTTPILTLGEVLELLIAVSYNFHKDYSDGRFFDNILINEESIVAWDGAELIDILYHELKNAILKRLQAPYFAT